MPTATVYQLAGCTGALFAPCQRSLLARPCRGVVQVVRDAGLPTAAPLGASVLSPAAGEDPDSSAEDPERSASPPAAADAEHPEDAPGENSGRARERAGPRQVFEAQGVPVDYVYGFLPEGRRAELAAAVGGSSAHPHVHTPCSSLFCGMPVCEELSAL